VFHCNAPRKNIFTSIYTGFKIKIPKKVEKFLKKLFIFAIYTRNAYCYTYFASLASTALLGLVAKPPALDGV